MDIGELLKIEIASVRKNLLPLSVLWGCAGSAILAYYFLPGTSAVLAVFADFQIEYGKLASFANRFVCGGVVPGVFLLLMASIRPEKAVTTVLAQSVWCGLMGIVVDMFFKLQGAWFGTEPSLGVVIVKTMVDQFGFCVLFVTPLNALFYAWVGNGFTFRRGGGGMTWNWFVRSYVSNIVMNWAITIPTLLAVYSFPMELQITVSGFVCAVWALLAISVGRTA